jgi:phage repressor protein C with HTH and peptisase S24 domain
MSTNVDAISAEIGARLRSERKRLDKPQHELAALAGVSKTTQVNYESGMRSPDAIYLQAVQKLGLDVQYILVGIRSPGTEPLSDEFVSIPLLGITASAGNGQLNEPEGVYRVEGLAFSKAWLAKRQLSAHNLRVIEVKGASMQGVLSDGDRVLIDLSDTRPKSGFVYVLRQGDELLVKYCQLLPGGLLRVSSANPQFAPYDVQLDQATDLAIVGRVVASMHEW